MRLASARCLFLTTLLALPIAGCSPGSALGGRFNNFRAYYNTFYNAERSFEEGERGLEQAAVTVDPSRLVSIFPATNTEGSGGPFQDAIDKSADLLRERPDSKWADDALLLIGKSYFYQLNFAGAEQKFQETMEAALLVDDTRLGDEARFWLGRTYAAQNRFDEGVAVLEEGLAGEDVDRRWRGRMQLALGELYARASRWDDAAEALKEGAPTEGDADIAARAYVLLAQVEEHAGRYDEAVEAYSQALRQRPAYELSFSAEVGRAVALGLYGDEPAEALRTIRRMRGDDKHYPRRAELALVEARLLATEGQDTRALRLYRDVLYDPDLSGAQVRGLAHYRLGEFYRDVRDDYILASAHLDTAATLLRTPSDGRPVSRGAVLDVMDEARTYSGLAATARRMVEVDSLLALGALSTDEFRQRIEEIEAERRRVFLEEQRRIESLRRAREFAGGGSFDGGGRTQPQTPRAEQNSQSPSEGGSEDGGFLSYRNPTSVQNGLITFQQRWGDRPLVPGWRRRASIQAGDASAETQVAATDVRGGGELVGGPPPLDLSQVPRTQAKRDEMVVELAGLRYQLANAFFLSVGRADTAAALYRQILTETPELPVSVRAQYALAEIERAAGRDDVARPLYEAVAAADTSALREASLIQLGRAEAEQPDESAGDETPAAYDAARQRWRSGDPLGGAADLIRLADEAPDNPLAPRAYLAGASAYLEWARADSLRYAQPLPDSLVSAVLYAAADSMRAPRPDALDEESQESSTDAEMDLPAGLIGDEPDDEAEPPGQALELDELPQPIGLPEPLDDPVRMRRRGEPEDEDIRRRSPPAAVGTPSPERPDREPLDMPSEPDEEMPAEPDEEPFDEPLEDIAQQRPEPASADDRSVDAPTPRPTGARPAGDSLSVAPSPVVSDSTTSDLVLDADASAAAADTTVATGPTIVDHLDALAVRYAGTPYAERAASLRRALLPEEPALAGNAQADSLAADPPAEEDVRDELAAERMPPEPDEAVTAPAGSGGLKGDEPLDPSAGGYTWSSRTLSIAQEGVPMTRVLRGADFRTAVLQDRETGAFIVAIGQFQTPEAAQAVQNQLPAWAQAAGVVVQISSYQLVDGDLQP